MFARFLTARKPVTQFLAAMSFLWIAACDVTLAPDANVGQRIDTSDPVQVALLVPGGSEQERDNLIAKNFENAARLAIADLDGAEIELRVYNTGGGDPVQAADAARGAVDDGAKIIIGPLYAEAANAAGVAVAGRNVNVLSFSNTPGIAGGNVFVLGPTFENTADRLVQYATQQGISRYMVLYGNDVAGQAGRDAISNAVQRNGAQLVASEGYPLSQQGIFSATRQMVSNAESSGAQAIFMTASLNADLPIVSTAITDAGIDPEMTRFIGLTRWDTAPQALALPGLQGGLFALPDQSTASLFIDRYTATYGDQPHPLAGLAYDGIAAIGALVAAGNTDALTKAALTTPEGFRGTSGVFRLLPNGLNQRALAIATIEENQVVILEQAPRNFGAAGL